MNGILCGYAGCGKTTVAQQLAHRYGYAMIDTDEQIVEAFFSEQGIVADVGAIFERLGEAGFRDLERRVIQNLGTCKKTVIACGGGVVLQPDNVRHLKQLGPMIYLKESKTVLQHRLSQRQPLPRFIAAPKDAAALMQYLHSRDQLYQQAADMVLTVNGQSLAWVVEQCRQRCEYGQ